MANTTRFQPSCIDMAADPRLPLTLYFDASCPLCAAEMHNLALRAPATALQFVDASVADFVAPAGTSREAMMQLLHARTADGQWLIGVDVFKLAYSVAGLPWVSRVLSLPLVAPLVKGLYPSVARHRQKLPRWLTQAVFGRAIRRAAAQAAKQNCAQGVCAPTAAGEQP
jgi:predicted DCC family thiol-disulfide oxidoreductase YuxK